jgi:hypothetical protein
MPGITITGRLPVLRRAPANTRSRSGARRGEIQAVRNIWELTRHGSRRIDNREISSIWRRLAVDRKWIVVELVSQTRGILKG